MQDPLTKFTFEDIITPPNVDNKSVNLILITQGILIGLSVTIGNIFHINPLIMPGSLSFDTSSMIFASQIGLALIGIMYVCIYIICGIYVYIRFTYIVII